jgi:hypothetical protein
MTASAVSVEFCGVYRSDASSIGLEKERGVNSRSPDQGPYVSSALILTRPLKPWGVVGEDQGDITHRISALSIHRKLRRRNSRLYRERFTPLIFGTIA